MTIDQRNAYYKVRLAARKGLGLTNAPSSYNTDCLTMWIAGHNQQSEENLQSKSEIADLASMLY